MNQLYDPKNAYRPAIKPVRRKSSNQSLAGSFFRSFFGSLLILTIVAVILYRSDVINFIGDVGELAEKVADPEKRVEFSLPFSPKRQNILVMGVDVSENEDPFKGSRSDAMLLVSIAPHGKNVNVISIPRDSKVFIADRTKPDKINHAFAYGGINLTVKTVEETFGVRVHHYIVLSNQGLVKFIDTIGGLPIYIEKDMQRIVERQPLRNHHHVYIDNRNGIVVEVAVIQRTITTPSLHRYVVETCVTVKLTARGEYDRRYQQQKRSHRTQSLPPPVAPPAAPPLPPPGRRLRPPCRPCDCPPRGS